MALTLVTPVTGRIHQRSGTTGTVTVTGTYTGSPTTIEARLVLDGTSTVVGSDWATKVASPAGNAFSFSFTNVPQGGWYNVQIRDSAIPGTVVTSGKVGVGILVAVLGQSQAYLWFRSKGDNTLTANTLLRVTGNVGTWTTADPAAMNGAISFGNALIAATGLPVGLIDYAWSGSGLIVTANGGQWVPTSNAPYANFKTYVQSLDSAIEGCVWIQGESDAEGATVGTVTQALYYAGLTTLFATLRSDFGASIPIVLALNATRTDGTVTGIDAGTQVVRNAQVQKCGDTGIYRIEREDIPLDTDNVHHTAAGFTTLGTRCAQGFNYALGLVSYYRGPRIDNIQRVNRSVIDVNLIHGSGTDITPLTGITGFRVTSGSTPLTIASAVRASATKIRLTLSQAQTGPLTVSYLYGATPTVTAVARDNSSLSLPLEFYDGANLGTGMALTPRKIEPFDNWLTDSDKGQIVGAQSPTTGINFLPYVEGSAIGSTTPASGAFTALSASGQITSTLANGTAPLVVTSSTNVANLNASSLNGATFAAPGAIGGGTPSTGAFTALTSSAYSAVVGSPFLSYAPIPVTDAAAQLSLYRGGHAYAQATVNTTGANAYFAGGIGRRFFTVVDYTQLSGKTLTVTVNGVAVTGTEGVEFNAVTSNAVTATNIGTLITAGVSGVTVTVVSNVVYITPNATTYSLTLATNAIAGAMTATNGVDGAAIIKGTNTNDSAAVGIIGELVTATVASGSAVSLTTATAANITSISLTAGDWDICGQIDFVLTGSSSTLHQAAISLTSATLSTQAGGSGLGTDPLTLMCLPTTTLSGTLGQRVGPVRLSIAATTTVYLVAQATFSAGTETGYGTIRARRMR